MVAWGVVFAVFALSFDTDFNLEIPLSQSTQSFVGTLGKDPRQNHGGQRETAAAASWFHWIPSFDSHTIRVADPQRLPVLHLLRSTIIRAPPSASV